MAKSPKLKVFRMAVGFHDAYVAAPSQKAAAEAWGADPSVFARGEAELVTDTKLTAEPLAKPGAVIKRLRGTAAEQIAALGEDETPKKAKRASQAPKARKPKPRPSRARLDAAEEALAAAQARQAKERDALARREAEIARERRRVEQAHSEETARLARAREKAAEAFENEMRDWRG